MKIKINYINEICVLEKENGFTILLVRQSNSKKWAVKFNTNFLNKDLLLSMTPYYFDSFKQCLNYFKHFLNKIIISDNQHKFLNSIKNEITLSKSDILKFFEKNELN